MTVYGLGKPLNTPDCIQYMVKRKMKTIYETIYQKLETLGVTEINEYKKLEAGGFMDLNIDILSDNDEVKIIAMAHNFTQNGDVMADPDMEIRIYKKTGMAEALTFQQDSLGIFQRVYLDNDTKVDLQAKKDLNKFLNQWLTNLKSQGFSSVNN